MFPDANHCANTALLSQAVLAVSIMLVLNLEVQHTTKWD